MIANALLLAWSIFWGALIHQHCDGKPGPLDLAAMACLVVFPCLCVLAARHLP